jgi:hypothetical protein
MLLSINIDPTESDDLDQAETVIAALRFAQGGGDPDGLLAASGKASLTAAIQQIANPNRYGENRLGYLRRVAAAGSGGVSISDLLEAQFGGNFNGYGGTHSSIERAWKALGGQQWSDELISTTPDDRQVMYAPAIPLVLDLVGERRHVP